MGSVHLPTGVTYAKKFDIPLLGAQFVSVRVLGRASAFVMMRGVINVRETVRHVIDRGGTVHLAFSAQTRRLFNAYHTTFSTATLSRDRETVDLFMRPPFYNRDVKIVLIRQGDPPPPARPERAAGLREFASRSEPEEEQDEEWSAGACVVC